MKMAEKFSESDDDHKGGKSHRKEKKENWWGEHKAMKGNCIKEDMCHMTEGYTCSAMKLAPAMAAAAFVLAQL